MEDMENIYLCWQYIRFCNANFLFFIPKNIITVEVFEKRFFLEKKRFFGSKNFHNLNEIEFFSRESTFTNATKSIISQI